MTTLFGPPWNAPIDENAHRIKTPIGNPCIECGVLIVEGDQGIATPYVHSENVVTVAIYHRRCFLQNVGVPFPDSKSPSGSSDQ
jgi:hypothetical protein